MHNTHSDVMELVSDDKSEEEVKAELSTVELLGMTDAPPKESEPLRHAAYMLHLRDHQRVMVEDACELCGSREAAVSFITNVNNRWHDNSKLCEICVIPADELALDAHPAEGNPAEPYATRVGDPLSSLSESVIAEIHDQYGYEDAPDGDEAEEPTQQED